MIRHSKAGGVANLDARVTKLRRARFFGCEETINGGGGFAAF